jgi:uncharacterized small protein (DUF1192 family)
MNTENLNSKKKKALQKKNLEEMSIEVLVEYISELEDEIYRVRESIAEKEVAKSHAKTFFKK